MIGFKEGQLWDKRKEKNLVKIATRGVVKLFNSIFEYKKKVKEDEEVDCNKLNIITCIIYNIYI